ncbi:MAG: TIGR00366 family protein [Myxococcota bacterium]
MLSRIPHVFALLTFIVLAVSALTYVVPSGRYERRVQRVEGHDRTVLAPGTYETLPKHFSVAGLLTGDSVEGKATPIGALSFLTAIPRGLIASADIIFFLFVIGGTFGILQATGTIHAVIHWLLDRFGHQAAFLSTVIMVLLGVGGSTLGMSEEFIPLVPVFMLVAARLGYDRIYGLALVAIGSLVGFAAATTNPFTILIAQGIAELEPASGAGLRVVFFLVTMSIAVAYVLRYGAKVRLNPSLSLTADLPLEPAQDKQHSADLTIRHVAIVAASAALFAGILAGIQWLGWWIEEMAGGFLLMGCVAAAIGGLSINTTCEHAVVGMKDMVVAALVVGFARGIEVVANDALVLDTLIYGAASVLRSVPAFVAVQGMLLFQTLLNFFIPSGSGQAAVTMPLMAPLADVLGITRQTAVFAFQCGDGFSNLVLPTSGFLMACLGLAGVPYDRWLRFMAPLLGLLLAVSAVFLTVAVGIGYA